MSDTIESIPKSKSIIARMILLAAMYVGFLALFGAALNGCATLAFNEYHGELTIDGPTRIVTGPIRGHWASGDDRPLVIYTVLGTDCKNGSAQYEVPTVRSHGPFILGPGVTLCMLPLRQGQTQFIELHAKRGS